MGRDGINLSGINFSSVLYNINWRKGRDSNPRSRKSNLHAFQARAFNHSSHPSRSSFLSFRTNIFSIPILNSFLWSQRKEATDFLSSFEPSSFFVKRRRFRGGISNMFSPFLSWIPFSLPSFFVKRRRFRGEISKIFLYFYSRILFLHSIFRPMTLPSLRVAVALQTT